MFDDESMLRAIYAFCQIYLCLLANVSLLSIKCTFVYYQIYCFYDEIIIYQTAII